MSLVVARRELLHRSYVEVVVTYGDLHSYVDHSVGIELDYTHRSQSKLYNDSCCSYPQCVMLKLYCLEYDLRWNIPTRLVGYPSLTT